MDQHKKISNSIDVIRRGEKYLDIASNLYALAYEDSFEGDLDEHLHYACNQAIVDAIATLESILKNQDIHY